MGTSIVTIYLESSNTNIVTEPVQYNLEVEVDLAGIWDEIISEDYEWDRIQVQTYLSIPTISNGAAVNVNFTIMDYFSVINIMDKKVKQYGYFEGVYDVSRQPSSTAKIWYYTMIPYGKEYGLWK